MADPLVIQWKQGRLLALQGHVARGAVQARQWALLEWPPEIDPQTETGKAGEWLRAQLKSAKFDASEATVLLSREECVLRRIELPNVPDDELADLVRLQAATVSSTPMERVLFDYLPLPIPAGVASRSVLLATVFRERVDRIRLLLKAAGIEMTSVSLSSTALAELAERLERNHSSQPAETLLAITLNPLDSELVVVHRHRLVMAHSLDLSLQEMRAEPHRALSEIGRLLVPLGELLGDAALQQGWMIGGDPSFRSALADRLGIEITGVELFEPSGLIQASGGVVPQPDAPIASASGALLMQSSASVETVDFLSPRKPPVRKDYTRHKWAVAAAAVALLVGGAYAKLKYDVGVLEDKIATLQEQDVELNDFIKRGRPTLTTAAEVDAWSSRRVDWLQQMRAIGGLLPGTNELYLADLRAIPSTGDASGRIRVSGYARERRQVEAVTQRLAAAQYRVRPPEIRFSQRDASYPYRFEIDVDVLMARAAPPTGK